MAYWVYCPNPKCDESIPSEFAFSGDKCYWCGTQMVAIIPDDEERGTYEENDVSSG